jgi:hypothetical protein
VKVLPRLTVAAILVLAASQAWATNSVTIESLTLPPGATDQEIRIFLENDVTINQLVTPLAIREISGGAFITSLKIDWGDRLAGANPPLDFDRHTYQYPIEDGFCKESHSGGFGTIASDDNLKYPVSGSPVGAMFYTGAFGTSLQPGQDASGSLVLTVDVDNLMGTFEIDTTCTDPANHLWFGEGGLSGVVPAFTKGTITVGAMSDWVRVESVTLPRGGDNQRVRVFLENATRLRGLTVPLAIRSVVGDASLTTLRLSWAERLYPYSGAPLTEIRFNNIYADTNGTCKGGLPGGFGTITWSDTLEHPVTALPEGALFTAQKILGSSLPPGTDSFGSLTLYADVGMGTGLMEIDTTCMDPANHLMFYDDAGGAPIVPLFTKGYISVPPPGNAVRVVSDTVLAGVTDYPIHVIVENAEEVEDLVVPLIIREVSGGAYIKALKLSWAERLAPPFPYLQDVRSTYWYADPDGFCKESQPGGFGTIATADNLKHSVNSSPEGVLFEASTFGGFELPVGTDAVGSMVLTVDVDSALGTFEVDTTCTDPANHLWFGTGGLSGHVPVFTKGTFTVRTWDDEVRVWSDTLAPGSNDQRIRITLDNAVTLRALTVPLALRNVAGDATLTALKLSWDDRLLPDPGEPLSEIRFTNIYADTNGTCKSGLPGGFGTITWSDTLEHPVSALPKGALFTAEKILGPTLPPGTDGVGSLALYADVGLGTGLIEIDTTCMDPANHLLLVEDAGGASNVPEFTKGFITVLEPPRLTVNFPDQGGTWTHNSQQAVSWTASGQTPTDYEIAVAEFVSGTTYSVGTSFGPSSEIITVSPAIPEGFYWVDVTARYATFPDLTARSVRPVYVTGDVPIGVVNDHTIYPQYLYKDIDNCNTDLGFTGGYDTIMLAIPDVDITATNDGRYIMGYHYSSAGAFDLERLDLTVSPPVRDLILPDVLWQVGVDPVVVPRTSLFLYAVNETYYMFDLSQTTALQDVEGGNVTTLPFLFDIDPVITDDGKKAIRADKDGYDLVDLRNPQMLSINSLTAATGADLCIDVVTTPDSRTAVYLTPGGYHILDIEDPSSSPQILATVPGFPVTSAHYSTADIDIGLRNQGDRFVYPADRLGTLGYDVVDISDRANPVPAFVGGSPIVRNAIDPTLTHNGRFSLYPARGGVLHGYDRVDLDGDTLTFIPGQPVVYDGIDIVVTPNDRFGLYTARKYLSDTTWIDGYDVINIPNAAHYKFVAGRPWMRSHQDIQILPDGRHALYPRRWSFVPDRIGGYDLIDIEDIGSMHVDSIVKEPGWNGIQGLPDCDIVVSPNGDFAVHAGGGHGGAFTVGSVGYACIDIDARFVSAPVVDTNYRSLTLTDPLINLAATTAEGIDQDCQYNDAEPLYPPYITDDFPLPDSIPPDTFFQIIEVPIIGAPPGTWDTLKLGEPNPRPRIGFGFGNVMPRTVSYLFMAHLVRYRGDTAYAHRVPEVYTVNLAPDDSVRLQCTPHVPDNAAAGMHSLVVEWYENADTTLPANGRLETAFLVVTCACDYQLDFDGDGFITPLDLAAAIDVLFRGADDIQDPGCPTTRADFDNDGDADPIDLAGLIDYLFIEGDPPCDPCDPVQPTCAK